MSQDKAADFVVAIRAFVVAAYVYGVLLVCGQFGDNGPVIALLEYVAGDGELFLEAVKQARTRVGQRTIRERRGERRGR